MHCEEIQHECYKTQFYIELQRKSDFSFFCSTSTVPASAFNKIKGFYWPPLTYYRNMYYG